MLFRLTIVPVEFMDLMNSIFLTYLDKFVMVFINDILIYSSSYLDYEQHLR